MASKFFIFFVILYSEYSIYTLVYMEFIKQHIEGVWVIQPKRFGDARGYFSETFKLEEFRKHVGDVEFVQDNESFSTYGVLREIGRAHV